MESGALFCSSKIVLYLFFLYFLVLLFVVRFCQLIFLSPIFVVLMGVHVVRPKQFEIPINILKVGVAMK